MARKILPITQADADAYIASQEQCHQEIQEWYAEFNQRQYARTGDAGWLEVEAQRHAVTEQRHAAHMADIRNVMARRIAAQK